MGIIPLFCALGFALGVFRAMRRIAGSKDLTDEERFVLQGIAGLFMLFFVAELSSGRMSGGNSFFGAGAFLLLWAGTLGKAGR